MTFEIYVMRRFQIWHDILFIKKKTFKIEIFSVLIKTKRMVKMNLSNGNETKSDIFRQDVLKSDIIFHRLQNLKMFQWLIICIFQFHCKNEHKQVKWNKIKWDMCKFDNIFLIYQGTYYLNDFWNLFLDKVYLKNEW